MATIYHKFEIKNGKHIIFQVVTSGIDLLTISIAGNAQL